jgi:hypothetical protein
MDYCRLGQRVTYDAGGRRLRPPLRLRREPAGEDERLAAMLAPGDYAGTEQMPAGWWAKRTAALLRDGHRCQF